MTFEVEPQCGKRPRDKGNRRMAAEIRDAGRSAGVIGGGKSSRHRKDQGRHRPRLDPSCGRQLHPAQQSGTVYVYVMADAAGLVKIGMSNWPANRIVSLRGRGGSLSLIGCIDGNGRGQATRIEAVAHGLLAEYVSLERPGR